MSAKGETQAAVMAEWKRISSAVKKDDSSYTAERLAATAAATSAMREKSASNFAVISKKKQYELNPDKRQADKLDEEKMAECAFAAYPAFKRKSFFGEEDFLDFYDAASQAVEAANQAYERRTRDEAEREAREAEARGAREEAERLIAEAKARREAEEEARRAAEEKRREREKAEAERKKKEQERKRKEDAESRERRAREEAERRMQELRARKIKKRWHFGQFIRMLIYMLPIALVVVVGCDVFNPYNGYKIKIADMKGLSWGLVIFLFVVACILALVACIVLIVRMFICEYYVVSYKKSIVNKGRYVRWAISILIICLGISAINIVPYAINQSNNKVTYLGGDYKTYEYIKKGENAVLPSGTVKSDSDYKDYITKYTLKGWDINGEFYAPGAVYELNGKVKANAVYDEFSYAYITFTQIKATITPSYVYNGKPYTPEEDNRGYIIPLGTEVTVNISYTYTYSYGAEVNGERIPSTYTFVMQRHTFVSAQSEDSSGCLVEGTLVTLADGNVKTVEDLRLGDELLVFNHETGVFDTAPMFVNMHALAEAKEYNVTTLTFDNGTDTQIVFEHGFFDETLNCYVEISAENAHEFIGHKFVSVTYENGAAVRTSTALVSATSGMKTVKIYNPASVWHVNLVANGMLTTAACITNVFEFDANMQYKAESMLADIEQYGLYTYDDFKEYMTEEEFCLFPFAYFKPVVEKGGYTFEELLHLVDLYRDTDSLKQA